MYFNRKYNRVGSLFQGRYKASLIESDAYYAHISRYIHLNPIDIRKDYTSYPYSSYQAYMGGESIEWLQTQPVMELVSGDRKVYQAFVADWADRFHLLDEQLTLD